MNQEQVPREIGSKRDLHKVAVEYAGAKDRAAITESRSFPKPDESRCHLHKGLCTCISDHVTHKRKTCRERRRFPSGVELVDLATVKL